MAFARPSSNILQYLPDPFVFFFVFLSHYCFANSSSLKGESMFGFVVGFAGQLLQTKYYTCAGTVVESGPHVQTS